MGQKDELKPLGEHEFGSSLGDAKLTFEAIQDGHAKQITIRQGPQKLVFKRVEGAPAGAVNLADFPGTYYSHELGVAYAVALKDGKLIVTHRRHGEFKLDPVLKDEFSAVAMDGMPLRVKFTRDANNKIGGLRLTGMRVRNLAFERVAGLGD